MDGYAIRVADLAAASPGTPVWLPVAEVLPAGRTPSRPLEPGRAARIMTGAPLPGGAEAVVPVEDVAREGLDTPGERVRFAAPATIGQNVRDAGRDVAAGESVLDAGRELSAHDLALAAALGRATLEVGPRPRAVVLSTGDELLEPGAPDRPGAIRDSNRPMVVALLEEAGAEVLRSACVPDDPARATEAIRAGLDEADVVITIGGVSAGDFEPVRGGLAAVGGIALWRVAMKPGRPQAFGVPGGRLFFGLPGNPASVACVFEALVRPAVRGLAGHAVIDRPRFVARAAERIPSRAGRVDFARVTLAWRDGAWWATPCDDGVSGHVRPQSRAHALLVVPDPLDSLAPGAAADVWLLRWPEGVPGEPTARPS
jgi:molybdopterin molybdotransferase